MKNVRHKQKDCGEIIDLKKKFDELKVEEIANFKVKKILLIRKEKQEECYSQLCRKLKMIHA